VHYRVLHSLTRSSGFVCSGAAVTV